MMSNNDRHKIDLREIGPARAKMSLGQDQVPPSQTELSDEDESKDAFFVQVAEMAEAMISQHGKEFAIGTLVLAAKFIAESRPLIKRDVGNGEPESAIKSG
jgi:hypothetical protein